MRGTSPPGPPSGSVPGTEHQIWNNEKLFPEKDTKRHSVS